MSDPSTPGRPPEGPSPEEPRTVRIDFGRAPAGPPNTAWSAPAEGWETPRTSTMGWGTPPAQSGWTPLPDGSWSPPASEATRVSSAAYDDTRVLPTAPPPGPRPGTGAPSAPPTQGGPRRRHRFARVAVAGVLVASAAFLGVAISHDFWQSHVSTAAQSQPSIGSGSSNSGSSPFGIIGGSGGSSSGISGGSGSNGSSTGSGGSSADVNSIASSVDPALVDINVTLGYQSGRAAATGIVLTQSGLVLTNNHVVSGATSISATDIGNGQTYSATVLGYDRSNDIALIQLNGASGLKTAQLGDSSKVSVGDAVVALGNAGGVGGTPSSAAGSIVATDQQITAGDETSGTSEQLSGLLQTDANIQPGDSGGPLVNSAGQVVGIDTAGGSSGNSFSSQQSTQGFAVPVNTAVTIANQIVSHQASATVHIGATAFLGVEIDTSASQGSLGGSDLGGVFGGSGSSGSSTTGAPIAGVLSGGPAAQAGLAAGDTIVSVDGQSVDSPTTLTTLLSSHHPGDKVQVGWVDQSGTQHTGTVQLGSGPAA